MDFVDEVNAESINRIFRVMVENIHYVFMNRVGPTGAEWFPAHGHSFNDITGRISYNQLPIGNGANQVAAGNHTHDGSGNNTDQGVAYTNGQVTLGYHPTHVTHQVELINSCQCGAHHTNIQQVAVTRNATGFNISGIIPGVTRVAWTAWKPG
jgi:hypothetical protein